MTFECWAIVVEVVGVVAFAFAATIGLGLILDWLKCLSARRKLGDL